MSGIRRRVFLALTCSLITPPTARAQGLAAIGGLAKDASGAVLPGVTAEASSPALIEKTRAAVSDGTGHYQIVSLPTGTYAVTFTLAGFSTVKREGIELTGSFAATVSAEMKVGPVSETITVSGESPLVDVQSHIVQKVMTKDVIDAIPTPRLGVSLAALQPGMVVFNGGFAGGAGQSQRASLTDQDVGGQNGDVLTDLSIHGSRPADMKTMWNGLSVATQVRFGESTSSAPSMTAFQEVSIDTSGGDATSQAGGVRLNYTPRDGGNTFKSVSFISGANESMRATNYTDELKAKGLSAPGDLEKVYDINPGFGGPVKKDALWFFFTAHWLNATNFLPGNFPNANAGKPNVWTYAPDTSQPQNTSNGYLREETLRLAWQASARNKFGFYWADKYRCTCLHPGVATSNEAITNSGIFYPFSDQWGEWTAPVTNKLLLEAAIFRHQETWGGVPAPFDLVDPGSVGVFELQPPPGQIINTYHGVVGPVALMSHNPNVRSRFALSYITGSHAVKMGFDQAWASRWNYTFSSLPYSYTFLGGAPFQVNLRSDTFPNPIIQENRVKSDGGAFVQDKWTRGRLTLQGGIRLDWFSAYLPEQHVGPSVLTPNRNITFPEFETLDWKDVTPKIGMAYDLTGDGKTALKVSVGKYVLGQAGVGGNGLSTNGPAQALQNTTPRAWNDSFFGAGDPRSGNFFPDCDLKNAATNGECGPWISQAFGSTTPVASVDDEVRYGWGKRQYQWELSISAQREIIRGLSVNGGYFRRLYGNFYVTDNLNVGASDYQEYSIMAPTAATQGNGLPGIASAALLPGGGGYPLTGLFMISQAGLASAPNSFTTFADTYGNQVDHWNGFDVGASVRASHGLMFQGGISTGHQFLDNCAVVATVPEALFQTTDMFVSAAWQQQRTCRVEYPWLTQVKFLTAYMIPKAEVQVGATLQSIPGFERWGANWQVPNSVITSVIGRPVPGAGPGNSGFTAINVVEPGKFYGDRLNQLDMRFGKVLRFGRARSIVSADIFNVINSSIVTNETRALTTWQQPLSVIGARLLRLSWQFDF